MPVPADEPRDVGPAPSLAVVVCTAGRPDSLWRTLESVWSQSVDPSELIIIDDGRLDDATLKSAEARCIGLGISWIYHRKSQPGLTASRNIAASSSSADVLLYLDDDVSCGPGLFAEIVALMRDRSIGAVSPLIVEPTYSGAGSQFFQIGYRLAGWWRIAPRRRPPGPPPSVLREAKRARALRWLSGAAMAIRRGLVLENPFDESLAGYALGEDREMSYRLATQTWLVEALRVRAIHRRDSSGRTDPRRFGFMTARNYLLILAQTCRLGPGEYVLLIWTFAVLASLQILFSLVGDRRSHFFELIGMAHGLLAGVPPLLKSARPRFAGTTESVAPTGSPRRMRVLFVTNRLEHGGAEWMLIETVRRLAAFGVDPAVLCLKDAGPLVPLCESAGIPVYEHVLHHKFDFEAIERIEQIIRCGHARPDSRAIGDAARRGYNMVVAVGSGGDRMFWSTLAGRRAGVPVVVWSHWCPTADQQRFERANRALYRKVDCFVALGKRHRDALIRWEGVPAGRIAIVHNGIDAARFEFRHRRDEARERLGLSSDEIGIALVANLRAEKRHEVFVEAARRIAGRYPLVRFFIIGDGPNRAFVEAAALRSGPPGHVLRLLGARDDVPLLLAGLDVCCLCSELECFSLTMLEAAAAGCAFVGPDSGSMGEFLEDGVTGLFVRPADADSLVSALDRLVSDPDLRARLARNAAARVRSDFDIHRTAREFAGLLFGVAFRPPQGVATAPILV